MVAQQPTIVGVARSRARARRLLAGLSIAAALALPCSTASADSARLDFSAVSLSFPSADPDAVSIIDAIENPILAGVTIKSSPSTISQLTVLAAGDLISGSDQIPVDRIGWQGQGQGFVPGPVQLSKDAPQLVGQWVGKTNAQGNLRFGMDNSWDYATGVYGQAVVYTLIAY